MTTRFPARPAGLAVILLCVPLGVPAAPTPDAVFEKLAHDCIEDLLRSRPETATQLGDHRFDGQLSDYSPAALAAREDSLRTEIAAMSRIDAAALTGANRVDAQILRLELESMLWALTDERPYDWNPLAYNDSLANSIYLLTARDFAPAAVRLRSAEQRLAQIPRVLQQIKATLRNPPRVHTETAIAQTAGAIALVQHGLEPLFQQAPALRDELAPVQARAVAAFADYQSWLEKDVLPTAHGEFRLGAERFRQKLRYTLDSNFSAEEILGRAEHELETITDAMYVTALPLYKAQFPNADAAELANHAHVIRAVLDRLAANRPNDETVVARVRQITDAATGFVRSMNLVTLPDTPLRIIVLPEFQRGVAIAYCDSPGALEPKGETYFAVSPTPADWSAARKESFYREYNDYMLHDLAVHEAMPGHYVQIAHANTFRAPTLVRAVFASGSFIEGWAVYAERVMADAGFGGPEVKLEQLKMRLRATINAILDQKIQMDGMTEQEALDLMMQRGFQEEGEAVGKWRRACQSSTQLSTYFVGAIEHDDMRAAAEREEGAGFNLKRYHDRILSRGSPPVKYVRQELGI